MSVHNPAVTIRTWQLFLWMRLALDFGELTIQGLAIDAKGMSGLVFVAAGLFEDLLNVLFFKLMQGQLLLSRFVQHTPIASRSLHRCRQIIR